MNTGKTIGVGIILAMPFALVALGQMANPQLREGLWSIHMVMTNMPGNDKTESVTTLCRNHAYDAYADNLANTANGCKVNLGGTSSRMTVDGKCTVSGSVLVSKGTITMSGDTASHTETVTTYTPAFYGTTQTTMVQDQKYLGSCPAGMVAGDRKGEDGRITHLWKH